MVVVTALDFHEQGELCVAARNDGVLSLINCLSGTYVPVVAILLLG